MIKSIVRALALFCFLASSSMSALADQTISAEGLGAGWANWSWDATINVANTSVKHSGTTSIAVTVTAAWGALYLHADPAVDLSSFTAIEFWVNGGSAGNQGLALVANGGGQKYSFTPTANTWTKVSVPLSALGSPASLSDLYWQDGAGHSQSTFYLDDIVLISGSGGGSAPPGTGPALSVDAGAARHAISSGIYGMNFLDDVALATELALPVRRWGGNSTSRYNWQNDTTNTGSDWYFENVPQTNPNPATLPDGSSADRFVDQDRSTGTRTLMTVPMMGWVAKRRLESHPYDCGFKVSKYGAQQSTDSWDSDCGNGVRANSTQITGNDPADTSTAINTSFVAAWVTHLVGKYGSAANGGVAYYDLDNEPSLWNSTHRDVHPQGNTYDEMRDKTYQFAAAVKSADPTAQTLGPVEWGWCGYLYSGADGCSAGADAAAHGSTPFVAWYLQQMKTYEQQHAVRILDYLDLHYYPAANGVSLGLAGDATTQALRLHSTRSLWDPSYIDESWISDTQSGGVAVQMIPRMKQWVADNYPGTRLAITEYNWGGLESINGALAQADVLGIFGREGLDLATLWGAPTTSQPGAFAFRMYRNYDAAGHRFGDMSVSATSGDQAQLAVYAAQRSSDNVLTVMVINKSSSALTSTLTISNFSASATAAVYRYGLANQAAIVHAADQAVSANALAATFPAQSITLFVLVPAAATPTTTQLTSAPNPSHPGQNVTLTATVTGAAPTGGVDFRDGSTTLCTAVSLSSGTATCSTSALAVGTHALIAAYGGDSQNAASTSTTVNQVVKTVIDFAGTGRSALIWHNTNGAYAVWLMNGTTQTDAVQFGPYTGWSVLSGDADFNADGKSDLLWTHTNGAAAVWLMNGTTQTSAASFGPFLGWSVVSGNHDFNGDGKSDLLWKNTDGSVAIWLMDGTTVLSQASFGPYTGWSIVSGNNDFNGDGKSDLLWKNSNGAAALWLMDGTTQTSATQFGPYTGWSILSGSSDFNGDGKTDLLWQNSNGAAALWLMNGLTQTSAAQFGPYTGWTVVPGRRDFNGDGKSDLLWSNSNGAAAVWLMNGLTQTSAASFGPFTNWSITAGIGDYNGDGKTDLLWSNTDGSAAVWLMNGGSKSSAASFGPYLGWSIMTGTSGP